jgi:uncharacterized protein (DUF2236 family)
VPSEPVLPPAEAAPDLVPKRSSPVWRYSGDIRLLAGSGYALLLQVSHPTVGAGVSQFSDFKADPWGRLLRTLDYAYAMTYAGPEVAADVGARVRKMHRGIKGTKPDGEHYHALEPEAYAWVHATLADGVVRGHRLLGTPMADHELAGYWRDWRRVGRLVGVRSKDLPETWLEFESYFDRMVEDRLEKTDAVADVLESLESPAKPPLRFLGDTGWKVASFPAIVSTRLTTAGMLPPVLRERFGIPWTEKEERRFRALAKASRASTAVLPKALRNVGPRYLRWRREALERGDVARASRAPGSVAAAT